MTFLDKAFMGDGMIMLIIGISLVLLLYINKPTVLSPSPEQNTNDNHTPLKEINESKLRTLITTGDVMFGRSINVQAVKNNDFTSLLRQMAPLLKNADLAFINLETPLTDNCPPTSSGMIFCADTRAAQELVDAGIDLANLANNHALDHGATGLKNTTKTLKQNNIDTVGLGELIIRNVRGLRFAFLGYNDIGIHNGIAPADSQYIKTDILKAKQMADVVIVAFHWGEEYSNTPTERQRTLAHLAIDAGADVIVGNHQHWTQPTETYKEKLILYSHGNFAFDQYWSEKTRQGFIAKLTFDDKKLIDTELIPIYINATGQPGYAAK